MVKYSFERNNVSSYIFFCLQCYANIWWKSCERKEMLEMVNHIFIKVLYIARTLRNVFLFICGRILFRNLYSTFSQCLNVNAHICTLCASGHRFCKVICTTVIGSFRLVSSVLVSVYSSYFSTVISQQHSSTRKNEKIFSILCWHLVCLY